MAVIRVDKLRHGKAAQTQLVLTLVRAIVVPHPPQPVRVQEWKDPTTGEVIPLYHKGERVDQTQAFPLLTTDVLSTLECLPMSKNTFGGNQVLLSNPQHLGERVTVTLPIPATARFEASDYDKDPNAKVKDYYLDMNDENLEAVRMLDAFFCQQGKDHITEWFDDATEEDVVTDYKSCIFISPKDKHQQPRLRTKVSCTHDPNQFIPGSRVFAMQEASDEDVKGIELVEQEDPTYPAMRQFRASIILKGFYFGSAGDWGPVIYIRDQVVVREGQKKCDTSFDLGVEVNITQTVDPRSILGKRTREEKEEETKESEDSQQGEEANEGGEGENEGNQVEEQQEEEAEDIQSPSKKPRGEAEPEDEPMPPPF